MRKISKNKFIHWFIITTFVVLYFAVSLISMIHVIEFFELSNIRWLAVSLAIAFEVGAAASLASIIVLEKMNKTIVWSLFIVLTLMQMMGNTFYAFIHLSNYQGWIELFGLQDQEVIMQKRVLAIISGAVLPVVALGFIKALVDYIRPSKELPHHTAKEELVENESLGMNKFMSPRIPATEPDSTKSNKIDVKKLAEENKKDVHVNENKEENLSLSENIKESDVLSEEIDATEEIDEPVVENFKVDDEQVESNDASEELPKEAEQETEENNLSEISNSEDKTAEKKIRDSLSFIKDPKLREAANEYINKTKQMGRNPHMKTTPGIG